MGTEQLKGTNAMSRNNSYADDTLCFPRYRTEAAAVLFRLLDSDGISERTYSSNDWRELSLRNIVRKLRASGWRIEERYEDIDCLFFFISGQKVPGRLKPEAEVFLALHRSSTDHNTKRVA